MLSTAFFLGKGGVGKTTVSAAFALSLARKGKRVLIASLDPAHNLGDVYGVSLGDKPTNIEPRLDALEVDLAAWVETYLEESRSEMKTTYAYAGTLNLESFFDIMKYSPGTEEYAVLWAIEHIHCQLSFDYDVVVFDTPPTALSLRFLAMPTISNLWIGELSKLRERILSKRESISRINPGSPVAASCVDKADDKVYGKLSSIRQRLSLLSSLFSKESYVSVVINPDKLSVSEALHIKDELIKFNIPLAGLCVNKRGVSEAAWSIDERLATFSTFDVTYLSQGLHDKNDLPRIETQGLVDHFLSSERKG